MLQVPRLQLQKIHSCFQLMVYWCSTDALRHLSCYFIWHIMCHKPWPGNQYEGWPALCVLLPPADGTQLHGLHCSLFYNPRRHRQQCGNSVCNHMLYSWMLCIGGVWYCAPGEICTAHWFEWIGFILFRFSLQVHNIACFTREQLADSRLSIQYTMLRFTEFTSISIHW